MKFSGRFKSRLEANVGIGGCLSPQPRYRYSRGESCGRFAFASGLSFDPAYRQPGRAQLREARPTNLHSLAVATYSPRPLAR
jgi:hypothetical protein